MIFIIVGPTAVGKTEIALALAEDIGAEIVSADSMQVYRGMDIGTAKPSPGERARVKHHMIDVADPTEEFSAGRYLKLAEAAIEDIRSRWKIPLVVGGTGLYVRALMDGIFEGPSADWALREELMEMERAEPGSLRKSLEETDPAAAAKIHPSDIRRTIRALEVCRNSGERISQKQAQWGAGRNSIAGERDSRIVGLMLPRPELYRRIEARVDLMMAAGLLDEVKALRSIGCRREMVSMQAIGYKQLMAHLDGETSLEDAVRLIKRDTKRYAKRQFTWFNADSRVRWLGLPEHGSSAVILRELKKNLEISGNLR
ncbi:MAG: tRNA (adenosine(37)-N6)-dimethylallyltransferase MiaA [Nitrospirota bacterium]